MFYSGYQKKRHNAPMVPVAKYHASLGFPVGRIARANSEGLYEKPITAGADGWGRKLSIALALSGILTFAFIPSSQARNFFVSPAGSNADGLTPLSAWNELDQINWSQIKDGDIIRIAGGTYHKTLKVQFQSQFGPGLSAGQENLLPPPAPSQPTPSGPVAGEGPLPPVGSGPVTTPVAPPAVPPSAVNNLQNPPAFTAGQGLIIAPETSTSQVIIEGSPAARVGIDLGNSKGVLLSGNFCNRFIVRNCSDAGIKFGALSTLNIVASLQIQGNVYGVKMDGSRNMLSRCDIHDNAYNILVQNEMRALNRAAFFNYCWIHNTRNSSMAKGIFAASSAVTALAVNNCAIGPGLSEGIEVTGFYPKLRVEDSLFVNGQRYNIRVTTPSYASDAITMSRCTSYMTQINAQRQAHAAISLNQGSVNLTNNIIYQGVVALPPNRVAVSGWSNVAYATTGTPIGGAMGSNDNPDLRGVLPEARLNNASISSLTASDYRSFNPVFASPLSRSITSPNQLMPYLYR